MILLKFNCNDGLLFIIGFVTVVRKTHMATHVYRTFEQYKLWYHLLLVTLIKVLVTDNAKPFTKKEKKASICMLFFTGKNNMVILTE